MRKTALLVPALKINYVIIGKRPLSENRPRESLVPLGVESLLDDLSLLLLVVLLAVAPEGNVDERVG